MGRDFVACVLKDTSFIISSTPRRYLIRFVIVDEISFFRESYSGKRFIVAASSSASHLALVKATWSTVWIAPKRFDGRPALSWAIKVRVFVVSPVDSILELSRRSRTRYSAFIGRRLL